MLTSELNRTRRMGVEIEVTVPIVGGGGANELRQTMARIMTQNGLPAVARAYSQTPVPEGCDVAVEHDGSITGETEYRSIDFVPVEVKTKILNGVAEYDRVVKKLMDILKYLGARVNSSTGHHIHVEFAEISHEPSLIRSFYNICHRVEPVVLGLVAPSRRGNTYCRSLPDRSRLLHDCKSLEEFRQALTAAGLERYWAINMIHLFGPSPRIEFRAHQGTLDFEKAKHWRNLCLRLIDHSIQRSAKATKAQLPREQESLKKILVTLGFKPNTRVFAKVDPELRATGRYFLKRWKALNPPSQSSGATTPPRASDGPADPAPNESAQS